MFKIKFIFVFFLYYHVSLGQTNTTDTSRFICINPETQPEFIGGYQALIKYLSKSMNDKLHFTNDDAVSLRTVYAQFIITEKGKVDSVKLIRSSNMKQLDSLYIETLKGMPDWKPGTLNGKPVRQRMNIPYRIELK